MADDRRGSAEQAYFEKMIKIIFPDRELVTFRTTIRSFTLFDLTTVTDSRRGASGYRPQERWLRGALERNLHDKGALWSPSLNSDLGDSWSS